MLSDSSANNVSDFSSTDELLAFIRSSNDILGSEIATEKLNALSFNCSKYENRKERDVAHFFALLSLSPQLKQLSELVNDPDNFSVRIQRLILLCRNTKTPNKNKVLNTCLLFSAQNLRRKDEKFKNFDWNCIWSNEEEFTALHTESLLEPNTTALFYRHLFAFFNANGLHFSMAKDFNYTGGFQAYWKELRTKGKKLGILSVKCLFRQPLIQMRIVRLGPRQLLFVRFYKHVKIMMTTCFYLRFVSVLFFSYEVEPRYVFFF